MHALASGAPAADIVPAPQQLQSPGDAQSALTDVPPGASLYRPAAHSAVGHPAPGQTMPSGHTSVQAPASVLPAAGVVAPAAQLVQPPADDAPYRPRGQTAPSTSVVVSRGRPDDAGQAVPLEPSVGQWVTRALPAQQLARVHGHRTAKGMVAVWSRASIVM